MPTSILADQPRGVGRFRYAAPTLPKLPWLPRRFGTLVHKSPDVSTVYRSRTAIAIGT